MNRILTAALMGYFMIIVFSIAGIPDPNKKVDSITGATKPYPGDDQTINDYSATHTPLPGQSLQNALTQRRSDRNYDHHRPIDFQMIGELAREVRIGENIRIFGINDEKLFVFKNETTTFEPVPGINPEGPRRICFADFARKAPGVLFITGNDKHQAYMEAGRFCQGMSLNLRNREIGSCIVAWFDSQIAPKELSLNDNEELLLVMALGFSAQVTN